MALQVQNMVRVFKYNDLAFDDPNPIFPTDDVLSFYANNYPEFVSASVHGPEVIDDKAVYTIKTSIGVKG